MLITLAFFTQRLLYQVLILSFFDCKSWGSLALHVALLPNLISRSHSLKLPRQTVHG